MTVALPVNATQLQTKLFLCFQSLFGIENNVRNKEI